ncbi:MAG: type IV pilus secretin PilQ [Pseudomonadales bacterium]
MVILQKFKFSRQRSAGEDKRRGWLQSRVLLPLVVFIAAGTSTAASAVSMTDINFNSLPGGKLEVRMDFDGQPPQPKGYTIEQPARIALDLNGVSSKLKKKKHTLDIGNAKSALVLESNGRTRFILNLAELSGYTARVEGSSLLVEVGDSGTKDYLKSTKSVLEFSADENKGTRAINNIDFQRGDDGEGKVIVQLSDPKTEVDVRQEGNRIRVVFKGADLPADLRHRYDVSDFATPVKSMEATHSGGSTQISVSPKGQYDFLAYQVDNEYVLSIKPLTEDELEARAKEFQYVGDKLSLNFQDIDVRAVLQLIADFTDLNLVASDTVSGKITLRLQNVPWDQALDLVLKTKGLDKRQVGNVLMVAPAAEIAERERQEIETTKQLQELAPLQTEFMRIRYANAQDLFELFDTDSEGGESESASTGGGMLSPRGRVIVDERTNSLLITETAAKLQEFRRLVKLIDVPVRQVLIEARIVVADSDYSEQLGIQWGGGGFAKGFPTDASDDFFTFGGSSATTVGANNAAVNGDPLTIGFPDALAVDLGVTEQGASSFAIGFNGDGYLLDLELSAFESAGHGEVVSQPKVITGDKQQATIKSGTEVPYLESSSSGRTTVKFKDAVLKLDVTPHITPDDRIMMRLVINQDSVGGFIAGENNSQVPLIDVTELITEVLVGNGETVVLGGVFRTEDVQSTVKTPFLGDIPYVGRLFKRTNDRQVKTETLIFITPRILADALVD